MELTNMVCATGTGMKKSKKCLEGTRVEILNKVVDWINACDPNTPHVYLAKWEKGSWQLPTPLLHEPRILVYWGLAFVLLVIIEQSVIMRMMTVTGVVAVPA